MLGPGLGGVQWTGRGADLFPEATGNAAGNNLPGITGIPDRPFRPGPGYWHVDGQLGGVGDGNTGPDPRAPKKSPAPSSSRRGAWNEGMVQRPGDGPPLPYGGTGAAVNWAGRTGFYGKPDDTGKQQSDWRGGIQGFNDLLTVKDRHAYWDTGHQVTGTTFDPATAKVNTYNNPREQPPRPDLRTVNRTVSYQKGSDATRNQDDLTRPYTWLGEQGAPWTQVNGGVPGLYQPYGTRGGVPFPIVSPVEQGQPGDGPRLVNGGPPHGLHSRTPWKGGAQLISRYRSTPQMRPVRIDRPANSPQAGQSYSQTVRPQGASGVRPSGAPRGTSANSRVPGRGWAGRQPGGSQG